MRALEQSIPKKTDAEIEAEEEERRLAEEEAAALAEAEGTAADAQEEPVADEEEEEEEGVEKPKKFVAQAMVSPVNPFSPWGNEPLLEVLEIPVSSLVAVRRIQRRALLEYKEQEDGLIADATAATVKAQQEALTVQLDERLRQWAPRAGRAEMDVYEVRDSQLLQHLSRTDRHVGALSLRAAAQQQHFGALLAEAQRALMQHCHGQQQRVASLAVASASSQLTKYQREAQHASSTFVYSLTAVKESMGEYSQEALQTLQRMNHQFLDSCFVFEELGGPKGKDGHYNPEEVQEYKQRLDALDEDAAHRYQQWIKAAEEMQAASSARCLAETAPDLC